MAKKPEIEVEEPKKSKTPLLIAAAVGVVAILGVVAVLMIKGSGNHAPVEPPTGEYVVATKIYQLKDASYLKLGFSIVTTKEKVVALKELLEKEAPGRLPNGLTMLLGNKTREDVIASTSKREALSLEIKKVLDERVLSEYNRKAAAAHGPIEVKEVLVSELVTQAG